MHIGDFLASQQFFCIGGNPCRFGDGAGAIDDAIVVAIAPHDIIRLVSIGGRISLAS